MGRAVFPHARSGRPRVVVCASDLAVFNNSWSRSSREMVCGRCSGVTEKMMVSQVSQAYNPSHQWTRYDQTRAAPRRGGVAFYAGLWVVFNDTRFISALFEMWFVC